jgi:hypothetical protein
VLGIVALVSTVLTFITKPPSEPVHDAAELREAQV